MSLFRSRRGHCPRGGGPPRPRPGPGAAPELPPRPRRRRRTRGAPRRALLPSLPGRPPEPERSPPARLLKQPSICPPACCPPARGSLGLRTSSVPPRCPPPRREALLETLPHRRKARQTSRALPPWATHTSSTRAPPPTPQPLQPALQLVTRNRQRLSRPRLFSFSQGPWPLSHSSPLVWALVSWPALSSPLVLALVSSWSKVWAARPAWPGYHME
mmetsp:Transcript_18851/g.42832  ORF Transcript_18851/g.42832 Transcript_18851/m.42832 type:complete len:216 (-) Transcript_18851:110-757(-)